MKKHERVDNERADTLAVLKMMTGELGVPLP